MAINKIKPSPTLVGAAAIRFEVMSKANEKKTVSSEDRRNLDNYYAKVMKNARLK